MDRELLGAAENLPGKVKELPKRISDWDLAEAIDLSELANPGVGVLLGESIFVPNHRIN